MEAFVSVVQKVGFKLKWKELAGKEQNKNSYFVFMDFVKTGNARKKVPEVSLKPCFYKKR